MRNILRSGSGSAFNGVSVNWSAVAVGTLDQDPSANDLGGALSSSLPSITSATAIMATSSSRSRAGKGASSVFFHPHNNNNIKNNNNVTASHRDSRSRSSHSHSHSHIRDPHCNTNLNKSVFVNRDGDDGGSASLTSSSSGNAAGVSNPPSPAATSCISSSVGGDGQSSGGDRSSSTSTSTSTSSSSSTRSHHPLGGDLRHVDTPIPDIQEILPQPTTTTTHGLGILSPPPSWSLSHRTLDAMEGGSSGEAGDFDCHQPLNLRYLSYRSSLALRLSSSPPISISSNSSSNVALPTSPPPPRSELAVAAALMHQDRERRIAAAMMMVSDDEDDNINYKTNIEMEEEEEDQLSIDSSGVRERLARRLSRNNQPKKSSSSRQGSTVGDCFKDDDDNDDEVQKAEALGAMTAAALSRSVVSSDENLLSSGREFTVYNYRQCVSSAELDMAPVTPTKSVYSATSSLTDANTPMGVFNTPTGRSSIARETLREDDIDVDPIIVPYDRASPSIPRRDTNEFFSDEENSHLDDTSENSLLDITSLDANVNVASNTVSAGAIASCKAKTPKSPTCFLSPDNTSSSTGFSTFTKYFLRTMLCGGILLLMVAGALALSLLLANGPSIPATPSTSTTTSVSTSTGGGDDGDYDTNHTHSNGIVPKPIPTMNAPSATPSNAKRTIVPSYAPFTAPTGTPTILPTLTPLFYPSTEKELWDTVLRSYVNQLAVTDADSIQTILQTQGTSQQRAFQWLVLNSHVSLRIEAERVVQRYALATFYFASNGTVVQSGDNSSNGSGMSNSIGNSTNASATMLDSTTTSGGWLKDKDECNWLLGSCRQERVTNIKLSGIGLKGTIPSELALLSNLGGIFLSDNQLTGTLPTELAVLTSLRKLSLHSNQLHGTFPAEYRNLQSIEMLLLNSNQLTGSVPRSVCNAYNGSFPKLFLDCGGSIPKITCPPGICCTHCCNNDQCRCVYRDTELEDVLC